MNFLKRLFSRNHSSDFEQQRSSDSMHTTAEQCDQSKNVVQSEEELLTMRARSGDIDAARRLGWYYDRLTQYNKDNQREAFKWYEIAAKGGDKDAMYLLGCKYLSIFAVDEQDPQKALEWYERAAEMKSASAYCAAGLCYKYGFGTRKDYFKAVEYLEASLMWDYKSLSEDLCAVQDGFVARSLFHLAECYENGWGCEKNISSAISLYGEAAKHGYIYAIERLDDISKGRPHRNNLSEEQSKEMWKIINRWDELDSDEVMQHAQNGNSDAQFFFAHAASFDDEDEAIRWALPAAKSGHVHAMCLLGNMYDKKEDYANAAYWLIRAAENGYIDAYSNLANLYLSGLGVAEDDEKAFKYELFAAQNGNSIAQRSIAHEYEWGNNRFIPADFKYAEYWYTRAFEQLVLPELSLRAVLSNDFMAPFYQRTK